MKNKKELKIALAQIAPIWLNKIATIKKVVSYIQEAGGKNCDLIIFGEAFLPGYPYWIALTNASTFDDKIQKELHSHYIQNAIIVEGGDLDEICLIAKEYKIAVYIGIVERAKDRGSHSLYCSLVYINEEGQIRSVHRKLQPTYEERLTWAAGDGNGLVVHPLKAFTLGGLNCWENWMPLARTAMYGQGENLHVAVWPGSDFNTKDITRYIARESRSFVISVSSLMDIKDFPADTPHLEEILKNCPQVLSNGGSCIAGPDGEWIQEPVIDKEGLIIESIDIHKVYEERQNFDPSGHYSRPDITQLHIDRRRQSQVDFKD